MIVLKKFFEEQSVYSYVIGPDAGGLGVIVDPCNFDKMLLDQIQRANLVLSAVLITHPECYMIQPLKTIQKIYDVEIFAGATHLLNVPCIPVTERSTFPAGELMVEAFPMQHHSSQSLVYRIEDILFTGTIVHAGTLGNTPNAYAEELLVATIKDKLFSFGDHLIILPSVGPPSTVRAEHHLSPYYRDSDEERWSSVRTERK